MADNARITITLLASDYKALQRVAARRRMNAAILIRVAVLDLLKAAEAKGEVVLEEPDAPCAA